MLLLRLSDLIRISRVLLLLLLLRFARLGWRVLAVMPLPVGSGIDRTISALLTGGVSVVCDSGGRRLLLCLLWRRFTIIPQYVVNDRCTRRHSRSVCGWSEGVVGVLGHTRACMGRASTTAAGG